MLKIIHDKQNLIDVDRSSNESASSGSYETSNEETDGERKQYNNDNQINSKEQQP